MTPKSQDDSERFIPLFKKYKKVVFNENMVFIQLINILTRVFHPESYFLLEQLISTSKRIENDQP